MVRSHTTSLTCSLFINQSELSGRQTEMTGLVSLYWGCFQLLCFCSLEGAVCWPEILLNVCVNSNTTSKPFYSDSLTLHRGFFCLSCFIWICYFYCFIVNLHHTCFYVFIFWVKHIELAYSEMCHSILFNTVSSLEYVAISCFCHYSVWILLSLHTVTVLCWPQSTKEIHIYAVYLSIIVLFRVKKKIWSAV